jgi:diguanylate cyclase
MSVDVQTALRSPKSYELARTAVEVMEAHQVWPTVRNFELWVHYVTEKESPLAVEIDRLLAAGEPITETLGAELAAQYLPEAKLNGDILEAGDVLSKELQSVTEAIESAQRSSEEYGHELAIASGRLEGEHTGEVKAVVDDLTAATKKVQTETAVLESQLSETTAELGRLRESLDQVRRDAMTDGLTNLANRKAFDDHIARACTDADETGKVMTLAVIDIDHFKRFNDTHGHDTGDQVLRLVAGKLARVTGGGQAYRCGGEEFTILFPGKMIGEVVEHLERLRENIEAAEFHVRSADRRQSARGNVGADQAGKGDDRRTSDRRKVRTRKRGRPGDAIRQLAHSQPDAPLSVTVSIGVAASTVDKPYPDLVMEAADKALYRAKENGRNRVEVAAPARRRSTAKASGIA